MEDSIHSRLRQGLTGARLFIWAMVWLFSIHLLYMAFGQLSTITIKCFVLGIVILTAVTHLFIVSSAFPRHPVVTFVSRIFWISGDLSIFMLLRFFGLWEDEDLVLLATLFLAGLEFGLWFGLFYLDALEYYYGPRNKAKS